MRSSISLKQRVLSSLGKGAENHQCYGQPADNMGFQAECLATVCCTPATF